MNTAPGLATSAQPLNLRPLELVIKRALSRTFAAFATRHDDPTPFFVHIASEQLTADVADEEVVPSKITSARVVAIFEQLRPLIERAFAATMASHAPTAQLLVHELASAAAPAAPPVPAKSSSSRSQAASVLTTARAGLISGLRSVVPAHQQGCAATVIQACWRGCTTRIRYSRRQLGVLGARTVHRIQSLSGKRHAAATTIQTEWRGRVARVGYAAVKLLAFTMGRAWRCCATRRAFTRARVPSRFVTDCWGSLKLMDAPLMADGIVPALGLDKESQTPLLEMMNARGEEAERACIRRIEEEFEGPLVGIAVMAAIEDADAAAAAAERPSAAAAAGSAAAAKSSHEKRAIYFRIAMQQSCDDLENIEYILHGHRAADVHESPLLPSWVRRALASRCYYGGNFVPEEFDTPDEVIGRSVGLTFSGYVAMAKRLCPGLRPQHVLAMRLYTTSSYRSINQPFRDLVLSRVVESDGGEGGAAKSTAFSLAKSSAFSLSRRLSSRKPRPPAAQPAPPPSACSPPHPYALTICCLHEAICHLQQHSHSHTTLPTTPTPPTSPPPPPPADEPKPRLLYRGFPDLRPPPEFEHGQSVELNAMSTTRDVDIATSFALKGAIHGCLLLQLRIDESADGTGCGGCDASWLSVFPFEREVLFPPFTVLVPDGEPWEEPLDLTPWPKEAADEAEATDKDGKDEAKAKPLVKLVVPVRPARL